MMGRIYMEYIPINIIKKNEYSICIVWGNVWGSDSPVSIYLLYNYVLCNHGNKELEPYYNDCHSFINEYILPRDQILS